jgi:DNA-3-methyladenine glycosylase
MTTILPAAFFARPTLTVARELLGQRLVRQIEGQVVSGLIVETEAYIGPDDTACHAGKGRTPRTEVMFGPAGFSYVYLIYGMYHMLNIVTEAVDFPAAVLIRAIAPEAGLVRMQANRGRAQGRNLTNGPGKLCQALGIDKRLNNVPLFSGEGLWVEAASPLPDNVIAAGPRVGIGYASPQDQAAPWRFRVRDNPFVSK